MPYETHHMPAESAVRILQRLADDGVGACLGGGWAVDALLGQQTREHSDLDLWVAATDAEGLFSALADLGIDAAEGRSQNAIGEAIQVPPSRMVALVDELERRGFVERRPDPFDRRIRALFLTVEGREALARGREIAKEHERELTRGMSAADRKQLVSLLRQLVDRQTIGEGVHPGLRHHRPLG